MCPTDLHHHHKTTKVKMSFTMTWFRILWLDNRYILQSQWRVDVAATTGTATGEMMTIMK
jgi:hypothetical protein